MNIALKKIIYIIILWVLLSLDFVAPLDTITHIVFHILIGLAGTYYIIKKI